MTKSELNFHVGTALRILNMLVFGYAVAKGFHNPWLGWAAGTALLAYFHTHE